MLVIRVICNECKISFWYIEVFAYYVCNLVYLCRSFLEQQIELVLSFFLTKQSSCVSEKQLIKRKAEGFMIE